MSEERNKETIIAVGVAGIFVVLMVFVLFYDTTPDSQYPSRPAAPMESAQNEGGDWAQFESYGDSYQPTGSSSLAPSSNSVTMATRELLTPDGVRNEMMRIIRAGRRLEMLRDSDNLTLTRRCLAASQELEMSIARLRSAALNLSLDGESISFDDLARQATLCVTCNGEARAFCVMAQASLEATGF